MADLITLDEYKGYKGTSKNDQDTKLSFIISSVSSLIKAYIGQGLTEYYNDPYTEDIYTPYDTDVLYLNAWPIKEIVSVEEAEGGWMGGLDSTIHYPMIFNSDYTFNANNGTINRLGQNWSRNIRVSYTYGYEDVPEVIKHAAIELTSYYMNEEWKPTRSMQGTTMVGPAPEAGGIPKHIQIMLDTYKVGL